MRLKPIEKPKGWKLRIAYAMTRRRLGKVITPIKVIYARMPESLKIARALAEVQEKGFRIDPELAFLVKIYVAALNRCAFCVDIGQAIAVQSGISLDKCRNLHEYDTHPAFSERERAAFDYVGEITRNKTVDDTLFARVQEHFNEREIVELTMLNAIENFYNLMNIPLGIESDGLCMLPQRDLQGHLAVSSGHE